MAGGTRGKRTRRTVKGEETSPPTVRAPAQRLCLGSSLEPGKVCSLSSGKSLPKEMLSGACQRRRRKLINEGKKCVSDPDDRLPIPGGAEIPGKSIAAHSLSAPRYNAKLGDGGGVVCVGHSTRRRRWGWGWRPARESTPAEAQPHGGIVSTGPAGATRDCT